MSQVERFRKDILYCYERVSITGSHPTLVGGLIKIIMKIQLFYLILITITTTITHFVGGELHLQMPLTINPVVQEVVTERGSIVRFFSGLNSEFYGRLSAVDMVVQLGQGLTQVMRNSVKGAVVLGEAARSDGLRTDQLLYNPRNKWTVNISLTDIRQVLTTSEQHLYPIADNITLSLLQDLGIRVLERKYNLSLGDQTELLHSSNSSTFQAIEQDWINVVMFIAKRKIKELANKHGLEIETLAKALNVSLGEVYNVTLEELDQILLKEFDFYVSTTPKTTTSRPTTTAPSASTSSPSPPTEAHTTTTKAPTTQTEPQSPPSKNPTLPTVRSQATGKPTWRNPDITTATAAGEPTEGNSEATKKNLVLFIGVSAGLLLLLLASSSVWCFRRKRRNSPEKDKSKNTNSVNMNNLWLDKPDGSILSSPEEIREIEHRRFVRSVSASTLGVDSRFKGLKYNTPRPSSTTFASTTKIPISRNSFIYDSRKEIFV